MVRRIVDVTTPNQMTPNDTRYERRYNRALPVLVCPSKKEKPSLDQLYVGITQDFSDSGMGLISPQVISSLEYIIGVWPVHENVPDPIFFLCKLAHHQRMTPDFWFAGLVIEKHLLLGSRGKYAKLNQATRELLRPIFED